MTVAEFLVKSLRDRGVTDVFGIPGGVILPFLYAIDECEGIQAHLSYHEQCAAFEACGYSQFSYELGACYATRGPGFTNLITGIAEAYADSLPVAFITSHSGSLTKIRRFDADQELDTVRMVANITKYAVRIDDINQIVKESKKALKTACENRKGPVLIDVSSFLWDKEINEIQEIQEIQGKKEHRFEEDPGISETVADIIEKLNHANRPVILIGDGVQQGKSATIARDLSERIKIPFLSSRGSQDVLGGAESYFGYIGSRGIRYANFIIEKSDCILSLGNRMSFPTESLSYKETMENKEILRIDIDKDELRRDLYKSKVYNCDVQRVLLHLVEKSDSIRKNNNWITICEELKNSLKLNDCNRVVNELSDVLNMIPDEVPIICDVGNVEFLLARAYEYTGKGNRIIYSKSFGSLGSGLAKAIGVCQKTKKRVLCVLGDYGFQLNVQELQVLVQENLPVDILVINNHASGMIADRENQKYGRLIHTTPESGYAGLSVKKISDAYGIEYCDDLQGISKLNGRNHGPRAFDLSVSGVINLEPYLPIGNKMTMLMPEIDKHEWERLNAL